MGENTCAGCGAGLPPEAARAPVTCAYCGATSAPAPQVVERVVERIVVVAPQVAPGAPAEARVHCPRCAAGLVERRIGPGLVAGCKTCGGLWLETSVVERLRATHDDALETELRRPFGVVIALGPTPNRHANISCPVCSGPLHRVEVPDTIHSIDVCEAHGTWFDARELPIVIDAFKATRAGVVTDDDLESAGVGGGLLSRIFGSRKRGP
jgi:Zn-finger nucleic acid-binding protein